MPTKPSFLSLTDLFCGAGGASIGAEQAGLQLMLGVNHWERAIATHASNFPKAAHDCRNISDTHPSRYGSTHLLWASPECTTLSQARGKKRNYTGQLPLDPDEFEPLPTEAEEKSRVHPWDVVRFAEYHKYEAVVVENVVEECLWGLLPAWYKAMEDLGYQHRTLFLNSMFFGVPQSRDRVYFVFWRKGNRMPDLEFRPTAWCPKCEAIVEAVQSFKKRCAATRRYRTQYLYHCPRCATMALPFVPPAAEAIDWSIPGERIGDKKKPLAAATLARIQAGIDRYWRGPTVFDTMHDAKYRDAATEPFPTQTGRQSQALYYLPLLVTTRGSTASHIANSAAPIGGPMRTITADGDHHYLLDYIPLYVKNYGKPEKAGPMSHPVDEPLGSITALDHHALLNPPMMLQAAGNTFEREPGKCRIRPIDEHPMWTLPGTLQTALVTALRTHGQTLPADHPLRTIVGGNIGHGVVYPPLVDPMRTDGASIPADHPLRTLVAGDARGGNRPALVTSYYRNGGTVPAGYPMGTLTSHDRHALVESGGEAPDIEDCYFRMFLPAEIGRGMAFADDYEVGGTQREKVQQYGQAVTPPVPSWIWPRIVDSLR